MNMRVPEFKLDILRDDWHKQLSDTFKLEDAFQQICHDLLYHQLKNDPEIRLKQLVPFPTLTPDGGIDSYGYYDQDKRLIIECKKNDKFILAKKELAKLKKKLKKKLKVPGAADSRYGPWFYPGLKKYIYCVSCSIQNAKKHEDFRLQIKKMLEKLSKIKGLQHLEDVEVTLYSWNDIEKLLEENRPVRHKWLKPKKIDGCEYLSPLVDRKNLRYDHYLYSTQSPYVRRDTKLINVPKPEEKIEMLLNRIHVTLPEILPYREVSVVTRNKLVERRKIR